jgi:O-antigen/teichoic acid export membrane protein
MISNIINYGGMFVLAVMITRFMGVDALGEFTYIFAVNSILAVISELGLSQLLIRKINAERALIFSLVRNVNIFKIFISISCVLLTSIIFYIFPGLNLNLTLIIGIAVIIPKTIQATFDSSVRALQKQAIPSIIKSLNSLLQMIFAYFILVNTGSLLSIFIMIIIMETLTMIVFYIINKVLWSRSGIIFADSIPYSYSYIKPVLAESFPFFGSNFLALSIPRIIVIILGYLTNAASLGIFSAASRFANGVGLFSGALYNTFYPAMTNPETSAGEKYALARKFTLYAFVIGLIISLAIYFLAEILIDLTFRIPEAVAVLKLLGFSVIPILIYSVIQSYLISAHYEKYILRTYVLVWLINIILGLFIIYHHGYIGAAIGNILIEYLILIILFYKFIKIWL